MHKSVLVHNPMKNKDIEIDEMLVPLITEIWKHGIETYMCCQNEDDKPFFIIFENYNDLDKMIRILINYISPRYIRNKWKLYNSLLVDMKDGEWALKPNLRAERKDIGMIISALNGTSTRIEI